MVGPADPTTELIFGKYELGHRVAVGGMAEVFLATQRGVRGFERPIILKRLLPELADQEAFIEQFLDEARVAALLNHPNVVAIYDVGEWNGQYYLAMEYISGLDIAQIQKRAGQRNLDVPLLVGLRIVHDAAVGLDHAHHATDGVGRPLNVVHRDVNPRNIMVRTDGVTKVVDFGIARASNRLAKTQAGAVKGTFGYFSPEQLRGLPATTLSDQFALGIVLWELTTGLRLFSSDTNVASIAKALEKPIHRPSALKAAVPRAVDEVVMTMLARDPASRFPTCAAAAKALEAVLASLPGFTVGGSAVADFVQQVAVDPSLRSTNPDFQLARPPIPLQTVAPPRPSSGSGRGSDPNATELYRGAAATPARSGAPRESDPNATELLRAAVPPPPQRGPASAPRASDPNATVVPSSSASPSSAPGHPAAPPVPAPAVTESSRLASRPAPTGPPSPALAPAQAPVPPSVHAAVTERRATVWPENQPVSPALRPPTSSRAPVPAPAPPAAPAPAPAPPAPVDLPPSAVAMFPVITAEVVDERAPLEPAPIDLPPEPDELPALRSPRAPVALPAEAVARPRPPRPEAHVQSAARLVSRSSPRLSPEDERAALVKTALLTILFVAVAIGGFALLKPKRVPKPVPLPAVAASVDSGAVEAPPAPVVVAPSVDGGRTTVSYRIDSSPPGAFLFVDNELLGRLPRSIELRAGRPHAVSAHMVGFEPASSTIQPEPGDSQLVVLTLSPLPDAGTSSEDEQRGVLSVMVRPIGALVYLDGKLMGHAPLTLKIEADTQHLVEAMFAGFEPRSQVVTVAESDSVTVELLLPLKAQ